MRMKKHLAQEMAIGTNRKEYLGEVKASQGDNYFVADNPPLESNLLIF